MWKNSKYDDGFKHTAPVGQYPANYLGLFDMIGNVWEWVSDWHHPHYYTISRVNNPQGARKGKHKLFLGNSWFDRSFDIKNYSRFWHFPHVRSGTVGFRCAK